MPPRPWALIRAAGPVGVAPRPATRALNAEKVLIVDDDIRTVFALATVLEAHKLTSACSPTSGVG